MSANNKVIISCAVTGAIHTPSMSPHLPITPEEIITDSLAAAEAGAAILHLHARNPEDGRPDQTPEGFSPFLSRIKQSSDAVINITTGGSPYMTVAERVAPAANHKPELASLNMGSMNFGLYPMLKRYKTFKFDWEREHLEGSKDLVFRNSFKDIEYVLKTCYGNGTRFEFECYDIAQAATLGGNVRVGLEDSLWAGRGELATSNAVQVRKVRNIIENLGLEVATPDEAREMLQLKGGDQVAF